MISNLKLSPAQLAVSATCVLVISVAVGCRTPRPTFDNRYRELMHHQQMACVQDTWTIQASSPEAPSLGGPRSVEEYIQIGLLQNPEIHEARYLVESAANRVPQAASLPDPMLNTTTFTSPVQTAAGEQDFALAMNQKVPWRGKLATKAAMAEDEVNTARANLAAVELKVVEQIKNAYYQMYFNQQAIRIVEEDREQLEQIIVIVRQMYEVQREVTQQDLQQVQVAASKVEADLLRYQSNLETARAKLARLLHVSPQTQLAALDQMPREQVVGDIDQLYELAIRARPELHAQLARLQKDRRAVCLAELQNYPDMTYGFNWIATSNDGISPVANGDDAFMLTVGMSLPVYAKRIDAGVREAQTRALANARKYDRLKDETMEQVASDFARIDRLQQTLALFRDDIIPRQDLTLTQSRSDYQVGNVDILQVLENWRQLFQFHISEKQFEAELQQAIASLARTLGGFDVPAGAMPVQATPFEDEDPSSGQQNIDDASNDENDVGLIHDPSQNRVSETPLFSTWR